MIRLPHRSLSSRITAVVVATVLLIGGGSFWALQNLYRRQMIDSLAESTAIEGRLVEQSLRYAMHSRSLDHLGEMVHRLADHKSVENVMILNKKGMIRFSSNPADKGRVLSRSDPTCVICHNPGLSVRGRTVIFETADNHRVFRNVNPILNSESCHDCHSPEQRVNGVLIVDYSMAGIDASLQASTRKMLLSALILALAIIGVIVVAMRTLVLRRIRALVAVVDSIEAGNLDRSADVRGVDEIDLLSAHLNRMTRSLDHSLRSLRERESFLDAVINSADDGIVVVDENLRIVTANRAFQSVGTVGAAPDRARCDCTGMCSGVDLQNCPARMTFLTGEVSRCIRTVGIEGNGLRHFEISASPLKSASGSLQVIEIWRDITERREFEAHLASQERLASLGLLASGVSHEINNPLASITTCLDGLRRRLRASGAQIPEELPEYLELIRGEVDRCQRLTGRLKVLGRKSQPVLEPISLSAVVREMVALVRYECQMSQVEIQERFSSDACVLLGDETQIRQVILNLILNAIQSIDGPGRVTLRVEPASSGLIRFEVIDTGRGIEPPDLSRVFEPFYSGRPDGKGTGLGLFISRIIVDNLDGSIRVSSSTGRGTTFTVLLPAAPAAAVQGRS